MNHLTINDRNLHCKWARMTNFAIIKESS